MEVPRRSAVAALALAALSVGCGGGGDGDTNGTAVTLPPGCARVAQPAAKHVDLDRPDRRLSRQGHYTATVRTSCGSFTIALDTKDSPITTGSFAYLAHRGLYDQTSFHRVIPHLLIQGGDPKENGTGGPGYHVTEPPPADTRYTAGTVAMGKRQVEPPGRSGSQFFVVTAADADLPADYALLGQVARGEEVVSRIARLANPDAGEQGRPLAPVVIRAITVSSR